MAPAEHTQLHESPFDRVMAEIGQQRWKEYKKNIVPVENKYIENVKWLGTNEASDMASGLATSAVRQQGDQAIELANAQALSSGLTPDSGAFKMRRAEMGNKMSTALADADVTARTQQKNDYFRGLEGVVGIGNNQSAQSVSNMSDVAQMARDRALTNAEMNIKENSAIGSGLGTAAGLGLGTWARYNGRGV